MKILPQSWLKNNKNLKDFVKFRNILIKTMSFENIFENTNDIALVRWNRDHQPHRDDL